MRSWGKFEQRSQDLAYGSIFGFMDDGRGHPPVEANEDQQNHRPLSEDSCQAVNGDEPPVWVIPDLVYDPPHNEPHPLNGSYEAAGGTTR